MELRAAYAVIVVNVDLPGAEPKLLALLPNDHLQRVSRRPLAQDKRDGAISAAEDAVPLAELAPTGILRVGLVEAPTDSVLFDKRGPDGVAQGVTVDLSSDLAQVIGAPIAVIIFPNTGVVTEATQAGTTDVTFMPLDAVRQQMVAFGPGYYALESAYLVSGASGITDVAEVERPGLQVIAISNTTTFRASARTLKATQSVAVPSVAEAIEQMRAGQADAFALSRDTLRPSRCRCWTRRSCAEPSGRRKWS